MKSSLDALHQRPDDENKREAVLNVLKILKDLGQIHRYHGIDTISNDTLEALSEFFSRGKTLTQNASALLLSLCRYFTEYIDLFLNEKEEKGMVVLDRISICFSMKKKKKAWLCSIRKNSNFLLRWR
ncbi:hypothetical protein B1H10_00795 [candidate division KSB1 bacterium 4484_188]|nr:MAG: hypothetical protein B1H10_00795 [candidate division KSB1 bacterium 4484_188]